MKIFLFFILCVLWQGCASVSPRTKPQGETGISSTVFVPVQDVFIGMTQAQVRDVMGESVVIGYARKPQCHDVFSKECFEPLLQKNPYRKEVLVNREKQYHVWYYLTRVNKADGIISHEELIPLIFEEEKLIGRGWDFLFKLKNMLE